MIRLQFVQTAGFSSKLIEWFGAGELAHVDAVMPDGMLLGARSDKCGGKPAGVQIRPPNYEPFKKVLRVQLPASDEMVAQFYALVTAELGKPYDKLGIAAFAVGRNWRDNDAWFCSELQGAMLEKCGWFPAPLWTPANRLTPGGLCLAVSARTMVGGFDDAA